MQNKACFDVEDFARYFNVKNRYVHDYVNGTCDVEAVCRVSDLEKYFNGTR